MEPKMADLKLLGIGTLCMDERQLIVHNIKMGCNNNLNINLKLNIFFDHPSFTPSPFIPSK